ncbi:MAG: peptide chain release factor N(5)-glutamine methyltransferase [Chloroflexi bacterium]|nr:peptide chain release factor N(5)-glutamine methyltransferase [Chloroflexota bacterium]
MSDATVAETLHSATRRLESAGIDDARLESEVLLASASGVDRAHLLANLPDAVDPGAGPRFESLLARRLAHEPLAYIVGHREFYGIDVACGPGALIPRPETEMLVELALDEVRKRGSGVRIADVGTGSGAIAIAIAANAPGVHIAAIESSAEALAVARRNIERHGLTPRIELREGDLLEGAGTFDVIVANLPYVSEADWTDLEPEIRDNEPRAALVGGHNGTEVVERLLEQAPAHLAPGGVLAAEIGDTQAERVLAAAHRRFPGALACVMKDLGGRDRMLVVRIGGGG